MNNTHYTLHNDKNDLLTYLLKVHRNASFGDQLDQDNSSPDAGFSARKAPENVWRPGSAWHYEEALYQDCAPLPLPLLLLLSVMDRGV